MVKVFWDHNSIVQETAWKYVTGNQQSSPLIIISIKRNKSFTATSFQFSLKLQWNVSIDMFLWQMHVLLISLCWTLHTPQWCLGDIWRLEPLAHWKSILTTFKSMLSAICMDCIYSIFKYSKQITNSNNSALLLFTLLFILWLDGWILQYVVASVFTEHCEDKMTANSQSPGSPWEASNTSNHAVIYFCLLCL